MDIWLYGSVLALGVVLTGISKSGFAGNLGVVTVPLLSWVMPIEHAAALMLPVLIVMDAKVIHYYCRSVNWPVLWAVVPAACVGIGLGALAMDQLPMRLLQIGLGLVCIVFALWHNLNRALGRLPGAGFLWGSIAGVTSTLIHAGGPPMSVYFAGKELAKLQWLATSACFFGVINVIKLAPYTALGLWSESLLWQSLMVAPLALLGVWLGRQIQMRFNNEKFAQISRILVFISGLALVVKGCC